MGVRPGGRRRLLREALLWCVLLLMDLAVRFRRRKELFSLRRASAGRIASSPAGERLSDAAGMSRSVAERATEMTRRLRGSPSETELEMCALGYRRCTEDVLRLAQMVEEQRGRCGFPRRLLLELYLIRASAALARVREAFPESAERINH